MRLAGRGLRDLDDGPAAIEDAALRAALQGKARRVQRLALLAGAALTLLSLLPG